jgi:hypothetical protein
VSTVDEYRSYADECFGWARTTKTERERAIFVEMAQTWLKAAAIASRKAAASSNDQVTDADSRTLPQKRGGMPRARQGNP